MVPKQSKSGVIQSGQRAASSVGRSRGAPSIAPSSVGKGSNAPSAAPLIVGARSRNDKSSALVSHPQKKPAAGTSAVTSAMKAGPASSAIAALPASGSSSSALVPAPPPPAPVGESRKRCRGQEDSASLVAASVAGEMGVRQRIHGPESAIVSVGDASDSQISISVGGLAHTASGISGWCWFECGERKALYNIANQRYPKMACGMCNSSRKALDAQAKLSKQLKLVLADLKKTRASEYKAKVRAGRLVNATTEQFNQRASAIAEYAQDLEVAAQVRDGADVLWLLKVEYIAYRRYWHDMSPEQASAAWDADSVNPDIRPRGQGDNKRIPLAGIPKTTAEVARRWSRHIKVSAGIENNDALQIALARVAGSALPGLASGAFDDVGGSVFKTGAAGSMGSGGALPADIQAAAGLPVPALQMGDIQSASLAQRELPGQRGAEDEAVGEADSDLAERSLNDSGVPCLTCWFCLFVSDASVDQRCTLVMMAYHVCL